MKVFCAFTADSVGIMCYVYAVQHIKFFSEAFLNFVQ